MEKFLPLLIISFAFVAVYGADPKGFISIDCGSNNTSVDDITKLTYISDDQYIDTGVNSNIASNYKSSAPLKTLASLRSFPSGARNCYNLKPVVQNCTYLIRAAFLHGNYDSQFSAKSKKPVLFDLYIGVSKWKTINITDADIIFWYEAITVALADVLHICLVNTGQGTPFISVLEMRLMNSPIYRYVDETQFVDLQLRADFGGSKFTRYPDDKYDRIWTPVMHEEWTNISTLSEVNTDYKNSTSELPTIVLQTAVIPSLSASNSSNLSLTWTQQSGIIPPIAVNLHFAEVKQLPKGGRREFNIYYNGRPFYDHVNPRYLAASLVYTTKPLNMPSNLNEYGFTLNVTTNSTEPALINAFEIFSVLPVDSKITDPADNDAILAIKTEYKINKGWTGDPCAPLNYTWVGIGCDDSAGNYLKILSLNLSGSGLSGSISSSIIRLQNIKILDLSNNSLKGAIPSFLANMTSLRVLNLSGNSLGCPIPDMLQKKSNSGQLLLMTDNKCTGNMSHKVEITVLALAITAVVVVVLTLILLFVVPRKTSMPRVLADEHKISNGTLKVQLKTQKFTKAELEIITENFAKQIGGGGFGCVFSGTLKNGTRVAVKKLSKSSKQGPKEFLAEAEKLAMLHHKNLLVLMGFCEDANCLALIYEYMPQGTLEDHIRGSRRTLCWRERLRIALEAAQGLEYMHKGCSKPIVHRDVKSNNILLGENLEAKVSDLGLARAFRSNDEETHTSICGTQGYLDPAYLRTSMLTVKSDVYSFGIVLFEIITGLPPVVEEKYHLPQYVRQKLQREDITGVIDRRLEGNYDVNSVWKVYHLATKCTQKESVQRPTMSQVVAELEESLDFETNRLNRQSMLNVSSKSSSMHSVGTNYFSEISGDSVGHSTWSGSINNEGHSSSFENDFTVGPSLR